MKEIVRKLYVNGWIRIPVKFVFSWVALKVVWDYYQYRTAWRNLGPNPRCVITKLLSCLFLINVLFNHTFQHLTLTTQTTNNFWYFQDNLGH